MSDFKADEDKALLLLVVMFEGKDGAIDWDRLLDNMSPSKRSTEDLKARLKFLTTVDTAILRQLPATYVEATCLQEPLDYATQTMAYTAVEEIFQHFTKADVRQPSGQPHLNAGEMAPLGVTALLRAVMLTSEDIFADVGSGIGNILAQVVLQSPVERAMGVEIRANLVQKGQDAFEKSKRKYPRLSDIKMFAGDVKCLTDSMRQELGQATVMFSNNAAFLPQDNLDLRQVVSSFGHIDILRVVMLSRRFCSRCNDPCTDEFCKMWKEDSVVLAKTCWTQQPVEVYVYKRRPILNPLELFNRLFETGHM